MKTTLPLGTPEPPALAPDADQISPVLEDVLRCVVERLSPTPGRIFVAPGANVADDDCCDGQVWTRLAGITPVLQQPRPVGCLILGWTLTIEIGVVRCAATVDSSGTAPTVEAITADAYQQVLDAQAVMAALACCVDPFSVQSYTPRGPGGGCVGGTWTITQRISVCDCADDPPEPVQARREA